jgi:hypothetical protein
VARGRVWVVQDHGNHDLTPAEEFGELVRVLPPRATPFEAGVILAVRAVLARFDARRDWLLLSGNPVLLSVAAITVAARTGKLRALQWDRIQRKYLKVEVDVAEVPVVGSSPESEEEREWNRDMQDRASRISYDFRSKPRTP